MRPRMYGSSESHCDRDEHLARPGLGNGRLDERKVRIPRKPNGASGESDLAIGHGVSLSRAAWRCSR